MSSFNPLLFLLHFKTRKQNAQVLCTWRQVPPLPVPLRAWEGIPGHLWQPALQNIDKSKAVWVEEKSGLVFIGPVSKMPNSPSQLSISSEMLLCLCTQQTQLLGDYSFSHSIRYTFECLLDHVLGWVLITQRAQDHT